MLSLRRRKPLTYVHTQLYLGVASQRDPDPLMSVMNVLKGGVSIHVFRGYDNSPLKIFEYIYLHVYINNISVVNIPEGELCEK